MTNTADQATGSDGHPSFELPRLRTERPSERMGPLKVFISYRAEPDEPLAKTVRDLIIGAIEPAPEVFVAGAGGLRGSAMPFKPQLQDALSDAGAVLALITKKSIDRAWLIFEAGAAWGTRKPWVPLLIDVEPEDLGSLLGDNYAYRATNKDHLCRLMEDVAGWSNGTVKKRLGRRLTPFASALRAYRSRLTVASSLDDQQSDPMIEVGALLLDRDYDEADSAFETLMDEATSDGRKAEIALFKIVVDPRTRSRQAQRAAMNELSSDLKQTAEYELTLASLEPRAVDRLTHLEAALAKSETGSGAWRRGVADRAKCLAGLGRIHDTTAALFQLLQHGDHASASLAALTWMEVRASDVPMTRLVVLVLGVADDDQSALTSLGQLARERNWLQLALACAARRLAVSPDDGTARNELGIVYGVLGYKSLAYELYESASGAGVSVSKVNQARLLNEGPVAMAGLRLLRAHDGDFDAADPAYPYDMRSQLEKAIDSERERAAAVQSAGERLLDMLFELARDAVQAGSDVQAPAGETPSIPDSTCGRDGSKFDRLKPFANAWACSGDTGRARIGVITKGALKSLSWRSDSFERNPEAEEL